MRHTEEAMEPPPNEPLAELTIGKTAALLGVTVRTLHHWDEIGLVRPSERSLSGYRIYTSGDLSRLHRVLIYRELDLPLDEISRLLEAGSDDALDSLRHQRDRVTERIQRLEQMSSALEKLIEAQQSGILLTPEAQVSIFGRHWNQEWPHQARQRWGDSVQWTQYAERSSRRSAEEWHDITLKTEQLEAALVEAFSSDLSPGGPTANALAEEHRDLLSEHFDCTHSMQVCIA
ncbi:MerR family transcriptional regulator [Nesterenkonia alkaliphila]|nr:MerR family transcriptional regulator [Nesterenkonia alkaliphila]